MDCFAVWYLVANKNNFRQKISDSTSKIEPYKNGLITSLLFSECRIELHHQSPSAFATVTAVVASSFTGLINIFEKFENLLCI